MSSLWFQSLMAYEWIIWKKQCVICYMLWYVLYEYVMFCVQYDIYDDARYSHGMTFLIQFGQFTNFSNLYYKSLLTWLPKIISLGKNYSFSCMSLVCAGIYPYVVQVCTNPINLYYFRCSHTWAIDLKDHCCVYPDVSIHQEFGRSSCFRGCYYFKFYLKSRVEIVEDVLLAFLSCFDSDFVLVPFWQLYI